MTKSQLRTQILGRRSLHTPQQKLAADASLEHHLRHPSHGPLASAGAESTVVAYVPLGTEPGSVAMLDALADRHARVLLPVVPPGPPAPLRWAHYTGPDSLRPGRFGISTPTGPTLDTHAADTAAAILVPAVAVDGRGIRLGRGAGYYDRTLTAAHSAVMIAVVYDDELIDTVPADAHDIPANWALLPQRGFIELAPEGGFRTAVTEPAPPEQGIPTQ